MQTVPHGRCVMWAWGNYTPTTNCPRGVVDTSRHKIYSRTDLNSRALLGRNVGLKRNPSNSSCPSDDIVLYTSDSDDKVHVQLRTRIATKTFDAIHRCIVYKGSCGGREAVIKMWEVSATSAGKEMYKMYVEIWACLVATSA